ncbi:MAG: DUF971 domain-containing protein [Planctomycetes bacterium]|nr:DUF971 domain-containing protein [Planctomycetota bacterium]
MSSAKPKVIRRSDPARVEIEWEDGARSSFPAAFLRRNCPCAQCVNELTGERMLDPESVPSELSQADLNLVGNYALSMRFSDGHHTGIFSFAYLRRLEPPAS